MSSGKCKHCGSTNIEIDPGRGDAVCTECGIVLEDQIIVSETTFEETPSGNMRLVGQFVSNDSAGGASGFGAGYLVSGKESREFTLQNARRGITHLCRQLNMTQHHIDTSVNFYKMALNQQLTRGRKQAHNHAACVYITCRTEGTDHMLIDISDILQICVHELGRTYLKFTQALCINIPSMDPCLYIMRFASKLEFGEKTQAVSNTAQRVVQRMKRDSIHSGRRPSGLCGAALLMAARLHEFSRSPGDIIKIVKVHESTLRKRLIEFGDTPSSALTLDEFMSVDLEEEQDPPAFKASRKKDRERLQKLENMEVELSELSQKIDRELEEQKNKGRTKHKELGSVVEETEAERFIRESNLSVIEECVGKNTDEVTKQRPNELATGLGPDIASMGLASSLHNNNKDANKESSAFSYENMTEEVDFNDLDDEELDSYIMSEKEANYKSSLWHKVNEKYLQEQKEKEEKRQKEIEEGKPEKKRRRTNKKNRNKPANTAGEAIEKMLQEKRISSKINYEVLKSLNVATETKLAPPPIPDDISFVCPKAVVKEPITSISTKKATPRIIDNVPIKRLPNIKINPLKRKAAQIESTPEFDEGVPVPVPESEPIAVYDTPNEIDEADEDLDEEEDAEPEVESEMSIAQMLRQREDDDDDGYGYGYDEEDY